MNTISITVTNDHLNQLKEIAKDLNVTLEELIQVSIESLLARPDAVFEKAAEYVLNKNQELYQRLAS